MCAHVCLCTYLQLSGVSSPLLLVMGSRDQTQAIRLAWQVLYHWASPWPWDWLFLLKIYFYYITCRNGLPSCMSVHNTHRCLRRWWASVWVLGIGPGSFATSALNHWATLYPLGTDFWKVRILTGKGRGGQDTCNWIGISVVKLNTILFAVAY